MLYLTRKLGQSVVINDTIEVQVVDIRGKSIKLGFSFPSDVSVLRRELYDRIQAENRRAAEDTAGIAAAIGREGGPEGGAHEHGEADTVGDPGETE